MPAETLCISGVPSCGWEPERDGKKWDLIIGHDPGPEALLPEQEFATPADLESAGYLPVSVIEDRYVATRNQLTATQSELDGLRREHLRVCRMRAGLSLGPAAELLGLERKRLGALEHGKASATDDEWRSIFSRLTDAGNTGAA